VIVLLAAFGSLMLLVGTRMPWPCPPWAWRVWRADEGGGLPKVSSHAETARRLGMTEGALKVAAHRLRKRYRELLRDEIAQTVATPELVDEEIRYLLDSL